MHPFDLLTNQVGGVKCVLLFLYILFERVSSALYCVRLDPNLGDKELSSRVTSDEGVVRRRVVDKEVSLYTEIFINKNFSMSPMVWKRH